MLILFICSLYLTYKFYLVFIEIKNASLKNKSIFIDEFKEKGYYEHDYTKKNYVTIKKWAESKFPQMDYIKEQDLLYASAIFRSKKNSKEYKQALKGKDDIAKIYKEIEFDVARECFKEIIKIENFIDSQSNLKNDAFNSNKKLFTSLSNDVFFCKKITKYIVILTISTVSSLLLFILAIIHFFKLKVI